MPIHRIAGTVLVSIALLGGFVGVYAQAAGEPAYQPLPRPNLSGMWQHGPIAVFEGVPFKADPVRDRKGALDPTFLNVAFEGDDTAPILKQRAAEEVRRHAEAARAGAPLPTPQEVCEPSGVPNVLTLPAPVQIVQLADRVIFLFQRDHQVRHIFLDQRHSDRPKPSWYGESVGHYEGETLIVDTIGVNAKTPVDIFGTPHSEALHVTERYRVINNGRQLESVFTVDDPKMFASEWTGRITYNRSNAVLLDEEACAENNRLPEGNYDIPMETKQIF